MKIWVTFQEVTFLMFFTLLLSGKRGLYSPVNFFFQTLCFGIIFYYKENDNPKRTRRKQFTYLELLAPVLCWMALVSVLWQNTKINSVMHKKYSVKINTENESESVWAHSQISTLLVIESPIA